MCMIWHSLVIYHFCTLTKTGWGSYFAVEHIVNKHAMNLNWCLNKSQCTIKRVKTCLQTHAGFDWSYLVLFLRNISLIRGCVYCWSPVLLIDVTRNLWSKMCRSIVTSPPGRRRENVLYAAQVGALNNATREPPMWCYIPPVLPKGFILVHWARCWERLNVIRFEN